MTETSQKVIALLSEALTLERIQSANSPAAIHICTALNTFGKAGQDEIRKANAARANRVIKSTQKPASEGGPRTWNPGETPGKPNGLPVREQIQSSLKPKTDNPAPESQRSQKRSVSGAGIKAEDMPEINKTISDAFKSASISGTEGEFQDLTKATEIQKRPTKVLEAYGIEQIKMYLELSAVEVPGGANDKEVAALLIQHFNTKA